MFVPRELGVLQPQRHVYTLCLLHQVILVYIENLEKEINRLLFPSHKPQKS